MTDPAVEAVIEQARLAIVSQPGWENNSCVPCNDCLRSYLRAALPILRRQHFLEAAQLIEAENERWELGDTPICYEAWKDAAQFLRGIE